jgi:hypothetical protein
MHNPAMDRLKQIESFVAVAAKGSLTAAAQAEGVAPAVIGRRIDALEAAPGRQAAGAHHAAHHASPTKAAPSWKTASACWPTWPMPRPASAPAA